MVRRIKRSISQLIRKKQKKLEEKEASTGKVGIKIGQKPWTSSRKLTGRKESLKYAKEAKR